MNADAADKAPRRRLVAKPTMKAPKRATVHWAVAEASPADDASDGSEDTVVVTAENNGDDSSSSGVVVVKPTVTAFSHEVVDALLKEPTDEARRQQFLAAVSRPRTLFAAGAATDEDWTKCKPSVLAQLPGGSWKGHVMIGKSTDVGQCLFSSVGMLMFSRSSDDVALSLRARCALELVEHWALYATWFDVDTLIDMLDALIGYSPAHRVYGRCWPDAETVWLLAGVLDRRVVVVQHVKKNLRITAAGEPVAVALPVRHGVGPGADALPLVLYQTDVHYQPLSAQWDERMMRKLPHCAQVVTQALADRLAEFQRAGLCTQPKSFIQGKSFTLDGVVQPETDE